MMNGVMKNRGKITNLDPGLRRDDVDRIHQTFTVLSVAQEI